MPADLSGDCPFPESAGIRDFCRSIFQAHGSVTESIGRIS